MDDDRLLFTLSRIEEQNQRILKANERIESEQVRLLVGQEELEKDLSEIRERFKDYTHLFQFIPVRNVAYGLVGAMALILVGALGTLLFTGGV